MREIWDEEWTRYREGRLSKQFYKSLCTALTKELLKLTRNEVTTVITMTTGHNDLRYHASLRDCTISPSWWLCGLDAETFFHLYSSCPRLKDTCFKITGVYQLPLANSWTHDKILEFIFPFKRTKGDTIVFLLLSIDDVGGQQRNRSLKRMRSHMDLWVASQTYIQGAPKLLGLSIK